ncbi:nickel pincer cofactor biosynthesis protein LarC [Schlesneria sp. T3-172]|uniref:nickel pincer cofactor biosynthesis protein LarC n=1 Tax=Schlesneria sphaerica TaxID=3373610 RepID=UPI0037C74609
MRIAYLDCASGISGDMTVAALLDAELDPNALREGIDSLNLPGVKVHVDEVQRGGFRAKLFRVEHPEQHVHRNLSDIRQIINRSEVLNDNQRDLALRIFQTVAEAEAKVHGSPVHQVHFHEVGAVDSIVDIVAAAIGFDLLDVEELYCSRIPTGRGEVKIAHGVCPIPTPGTAELLKGIPLSDVPVNAELTTPTGAAIVKTLASHFVDALPEMTIDTIGYGAGTRDLEGRANILRLIIGKTAGVESSGDSVMLLETNLDDTQGEILGYTKRRLLEAGALDVYTTGIQMKKDRPAVMLSVICRSEEVGKLESIIFSETQTFGIRRQRVHRSIRDRMSYTVETDFGPIKGKVGWRENEAAVFKPEFDHCVEIAKAHELPLRDVYMAAQFAFHLEDDIDDDEDGDDEEGEHDHDHDHDCGHDHDHDHGHDCGHDHDHNH